MNGMANPSTPIPRIGIPRIGIIGFGEVGSSFARGLIAAGAGDIVAYDAPPGPTERRLALRRADELGLALAVDPAALADREILFSSVTQDAADNAATTVAPHVATDAIYADVNSLSPEVKAAVGGRLDAVPGRFVDVAIMGAPASDLHRVPLLAAGRRAEELAARLAPFGTGIRVVGPEPGRAAAVKILRSILTKGLETLLVEALTAARRHGVEAEVLGGFLELFDRRPALDFVDFLVRSDTVHSGRRALEAAQSADTVAAVGLEPAMSRAVAARLSQLAGLGLKERLGGVPPASLSDAVTLFDEALGRRHPTEQRHGIEHPQN
ncbi:NAD(P)-dependent oxidoreductase (plasmid) [Azospirillum argentinense]|uniref:NAD(P)-dependent oxidoreductase n=2 Tax=Azospirillum argentinense TaxID=2970906 RepID=A0A4D8PQA7_9PROT|nr:NAD(P)-dependent oxidoreductase [Azospirillum argentinense]